jgi:hypothetical protein
LQQRLQAQMIGAIAGTRNTITEAPGDPDG